VGVGWGNVEKSLNSKVLTQPKTQRSLFPSKLAELWCPLMPI